jgi:Lrp/AsnC family transcriptional regulator, regulator for asnA, asnC and gidA
MATTYATARTAGTTDSAASGTGSDGIGCERRRPAGRLAFVPPRGRDKSGPVALDDVSKAIVEQLQQDGRRSYADIGKHVGLSEAAVRQRVQRLTETGVMQIVAVTDPMQLGFYRQAMIGIRVTGDTTRVARLLGEIPAVDYVVLTAGSFDILAEVVCENDDDLIELLNQRIRGIEGVQSTETFVYLRLHKQFYNWGTR